MQENSSLNSKDCEICGRAFPDLENQFICSHLICNECIYYTSFLFAGKIYKTHNDIRIQFPCPFCESASITTLDYFISESTVHSIKGKVEEKICDSCETNRLNVYCLNCKIYYCNECLDNIHNKIIKFKSHVTTEDLTLKSSLNFCSCDRERINMFYCITCDFPACEECTINYHLEHNFKHAMNDYKQSLETDLKNKFTTKINQSLNVDEELEKIDLLINNPDKFSPQNCDLFKNFRTNFLIGLEKIIELYSTQCSGSTHRIVVYIEIFKRLLDRLLLQQQTIVKIIDSEKHPYIKLKKITESEKYSVLHRLNRFNKAFINNIKNDVSALTKLGEVDNKKRITIIDGKIAFKGDPVKSFTKKLNLVHSSKMYQEIFPYMICAFRSSSGQCFVAYINNRDFNVELINITKLNKFKKFDGLSFDIILNENLISKYNSNNNSKYTSKSNSRMETSVIGNATPFKTNFSSKIVEDNKQNSNEIINSPSPFKSTNIINSLSENKSTASVQSYKSGSSSPMYRTPRIAEIHSKKKSKLSHYSKNNDKAQSLPISKNIIDKKLNLQKQPNQQQQQKQQKKKQKGGFISEGLMFKDKFYSFDSHTDTIYGIRQYRVEKEDFIISYSEDRTVRIWSCDFLREVVKIDHDHPIRSAAILMHEGFKYVIVGSYIKDYPIAVYSFTGSFLNQIKTTGYTYFVDAYSSETKAYVFSSTYKPYALNIYNFDTCEKLYSIQTTSYVNCCIPLQFETLIITFIDRSGVLKQFDIDNGKTIFESNNYGNYHITKWNEKNYIMCGKGHGFTVFDINDLSIQAEYNYVHKDILKGAIKLQHQFYGDLLLTIGQDQTIRILN